MSGGVDSSMAAALLKEAGFEVIGIRLRLWQEENQHHPSNTHHPKPDGTDDAERVCRQLGIPFFVLDLESEFRSYDVDYYYQEYRQGRTPNPCVACNEHIKFGFLLRYALAQGAKYLATGHYVRIRPSAEGYHLLKAVLPAKDQSYFLYAMSQQYLQHLLLPLGSYSMP